MTTLSAAIRRGSFGMSQIRNKYFDAIPAKSCCALGAAAFGGGIVMNAPEFPPVMTFVTSAFPYVESTDERLVTPLQAALVTHAIQNPDLEIDPHLKTLGELVVIANDEAGFTFEQIAQLVAAGEFAFFESSICTEKMEKKDAETV